MIKQLGTILGKNLATFLKRFRDLSKKRLNSDYVYAKIWQISTTLRLFLVSKNKQMPDQFWKKIAYKKVYIFPFC